MKKYVTKHTSSSRTKAYTAPRSGQYATTGARASRSSLFASSGAKGAGQQYRESIAAVLAEIAASRERMKQDQSEIVRLRNETDARIQRFLDRVDSLGGS